MKNIFLSFLVLLFTTNLYAQKTDSLKELKRTSFGFSNELGYSHFFSEIELLPVGLDYSRLSNSFETFYIYRLSKKRELSLGISFMKIQEKNIITGKIPSIELRSFKFFGIPLNYTRYYNVHKKLDLVIQTGLGINFIFKANINGTYINSSSPFSEYIKYETFGIYTSVFASTGIRYSINQRINILMLPKINLFLTNINSEIKYGIPLKQGAGFIKIYGKRERIVNALLKIQINYNL